MNFTSIDILKKELDSFRPLPAETVESLHKDLIVRWTYNSNAIEGNTLTIYETKVVLEEGITIGGKKLREHFEVINHKDAILFVEEIVQDKIELSENIIKSIHHLILTNIDKKNAGRYRTRNVLISGASHTAPDHFNINPEMENLISWYKNSELHPIEKAALLHCKFVNIHPFIDGNGRTARLLISLQLMKGGYPPIIIKTEDRFKYYELLDKGAVEEEYSPFISMITNYCENHIKSIIKLVENKD